MGRPKSNHPVLWICVAVMLARLVVLVQIYEIDPQRVIQPDSGTYQGPARALVELGRFSNSPENPRPEIERTPGYPLFIASSYELAGEDDRVMLILQVILSIATIALAAAIARELWGEQAAIAAALALALDPISFLYSQLVLSDGFFAIVFSLHIWTVLRLLRQRQRPWLWALASGLTLAAATYVRPIAYYFALPLLLFIVWAFRRDGVAWRTSLLVAAMIFIAWAPAAAGWQWRNYRLTGVSDFSAIQNRSLFFYRGGGIVAQKEGISLEAAKEKLLAAVPADVQANDVTWYAYCRREGFRLVRENPLLMIKDQIYGLGRTVFGPGLEGFGKAYGSTARYVTAYSAIYLLATYLLVLISVIHLFRQRRLTLPQHLFLWLVIFYLAGISAGPEAYSRFRLPIMPILAVYAAGGWLLVVGRGGDRIIRSS